MTATGILAAVMLSALGPSTAVAFEAAEDQPSPAARHQPVEPVSEPAPPQAPPSQAPPPRATPPHPTPKPKPKPKPTPLKQTPTIQEPTDLKAVEQAPGQQGPGQQGPVDQAPVNPNPVRPDEPPAAPVIPVPGPAEPQPPEDGEPAVPVGGSTGQAGGGPRATPTTGQGTPLPPGLGPASRVRLVVAGATVSGIAAVAAWLVLGGRGRERAPVGTPQRPATRVTPADGMQLDLEVVVKRQEGAPRLRYTGRRSGVAGTTLWRDEDDRPRWVRRFDELGPPRRRVPRSPLEPDDDAMPWLTGVPWSAGDEHRKN